MSRPSAKLKKLVERLVRYACRAAREYGAADGDVVGWYEDLPDGGVTVHLLLKLPPRKRRRRKEPPFEVDETHSKLDPSKFDLRMVRGYPWQNN